MRLKTWQEPPPRELFIFICAEVLVPPALHVSSFSLNNIRELYNAEQWLGTKKQWVRVETSLQGNAIGYNPGYNRIVFYAEQTSTYRNNEGEFPWTTSFIYTHSPKNPVTTMLTYPWKCTVLHCNHLGNTWKPLVLMTRHFDYCPSASEGDNQSVGSSAPVVSRCFPGGYNVKLYISRGRLAWWLLDFLHSDISNIELVEINYGGPEDSGKECKPNVNDGKAQMREALMRQEHKDRKKWWEKSTNTEKGDDKQHKHRSSDKKVQMQKLCSEKIIQKQKIWWEKSTVTETVMRQEHKYGICDDERV